MSNSLAATGRVIDAITGRAPRLADEPDFRYMLARDAATPADVLAFMSDRFVGEVIGPRQKVLEARRQIALAELSRPGYAALLYGWMYGRMPASADELVASGLLKREELAHAGGERIDWQPGRAARSSWGAVGELTPLIDLPALAKVTPSEKAAYEHVRRRLPELLAHQHRSRRDPDRAPTRWPRAAVRRRARAADHHRHRLRGHAADRRSRARRAGRRRRRRPAHGARASGPTPRSASCSPVRCARCRWSDRSRRTGWETGRCWAWTTRPRRASREVMQERSDHRRVRAVDARPRRAARSTRASRCAT